MLSFFDVDAFKMIDIIDRLDEFTDEQRMDVFYNYCTFCGAKIHRTEKDVCNCMRVD